MPTTPTSMVNRLMGVEAFTDPISLPAGTTVGGKTLDSGNSLVTAITTLAVTKALHDGKTILLSLLAGFTSTLPAAVGSGMAVRFMIGIVRTSNSYIIVTTGSDVFNGLVQIAPNGSAVGLSESFGSTANKTLTMNATTTGGLLIGDWVEVRDILTGVWAITGLLTGSGTLATPFSN